MSDFWLSVISESVSGVVSALLWAVALQFQRFGH
jgi:hypothetical protein